MSGLLGMLKALGIDPEALKQQAEALFKRFDTLETRLVSVSEERLAALEADIAALKVRLMPEAETLAEAGLSEIESKIQE